MLAAPAPGSCWLRTKSTQTDGWVQAGKPPRLAPASGKNREARDDRPASRREVTAGALCAFGCLAQVCATPGRKRERWAAPGGRKSWHFLSVPSTSAGDYRELPRVPLRGEGCCGVGRASRDSAGFGAMEEGLFATLWTVAYQAPLSMRFPRQEYWSGLPYPPPGETQGSNPGLLHCRWILYQLSHQGSIEPRAPHIGSIPGEEN